MFFKFIVFAMLISADKDNGFPVISLLFSKKHIYPSLI